jgi:endonuclease YncB( thermonuclease family)
VLALVVGLKHKRNSASLSTEDIAGIARVADGDTLTIGKTKIRLAGIDAPEIDQECQAEGQAYRCGKRAAIALDELLRSRTGHTVHCRRAGQDRYQRVLARCLVDDVDVNGWMVEQGWAVSYRRFSDEYVGQENRAREARRGIWAGQFENPEDFRHGRLARVPGRSAQRSGGLIPATAADAENKR